LLGVARRPANMVGIDLLMRTTVGAAVMAVTSAGKPPNFVVLFLDDHGWGDFSGNDPRTTETPRMAQMASEGLRFSDFHSSFSVCTASRGALLTGRLCPRTGVCGNFGPTSKQGMALSERTIADVLAPAGYESHAIGKWHLGHNPLYHPSFRGFSTYTGLPYSGDMGCLDSTPQSCAPSCDRAHGQPACPALCLTNGTDCGIAIPLYQSPGWAGTNCSGTTNCNAEIVQAPFNPFLLNEHYVGSAAKAFGRYGAGGAREGHPFFLYVAFAHTHTPLAYAPRWANVSTRPGRLSVFGDTLAEVDGAVGSILDALDGAGLGNDTLVFLSADNGPADLGSVACEAIGSPGKYTGAWQKSPTGGGGGGTCKSTTWEGGHRMVGLARWLGHIKEPGRTTTALAMTVDFMPTFVSLAAAAGAAVVLPADRAYDGVDLTAVLLNGSNDGHTTLFHPHDHGIGIDAVPAMRYKQYKAHFKTSGSQPCRMANGSHLPSGKTLYHDPPLIFDVDADPGESTPIDPSTIHDVLEDIAHEYAAFWQSVKVGLLSNTSYSSDSAFKPCGNSSDCACRTTRPF